MDAAPSHFGQLETMDPVSIATEDVIEGLKASGSHTISESAAQMIVERSPMFRSNPSAMIDHVAGVVSYSVTFPFNYIELDKGGWRFERKRTVPDFDF